MHPDGGPQYRQIADAIAEDVAQGRLMPGQRLPPQRDLAWRIGVTVGTVSRSYALAEQRGLVTGEVGRGTFVRDRDDSDALARLIPAAETNCIDLRYAAPFPGPERPSLEGTLAALNGRSDTDRLFGYVQFGGYPPYQAAGAAWLRQVGLDVAAEQVTLTNGAQQALTAALLCFGRDGVMTEALTYPGFLHAAGLAGARVEAVAIDEHGLLPDDLDRVAEASGTRLLLIAPTLHNPTSGIMSLERRQQVVEIARRRDLLIIEDDVYGYVVGERPPPIASLAPERTIYITSASKSVAPGLRIGWTATPPTLTEQFAATVYAMSICPPPLTALIASLWIEDGTARRLTAAHAERLAGYHEVAARLLAPFEYVTHPASLFLLLTLPDPWRSEAFCDAAMARGVGVAAAGSFAVGRSPAPHAVRVAIYAAKNREELERALTIIADLAAAPPRMVQALV